MEKPKYSGQLIGYAFECRCPNCKTKQWFSPRRKEIILPIMKKNTDKRCVNCGKSFNVGRNLIKRKEIKTR